MIETIVHYADGHKELMTFSDLNTLVAWAVGHHGEYTGFETVPKREEREEK